MSTETIKLKLAPTISRKKASRIEFEFMMACKHLDASIFEPFIEEDDCFDEQDKYLFLASLKDKFDGAKRRGVNETKIKKGRCELCSFGALTYEFYGLENTPEFAYVVRWGNDQIRDVYECNASSGWSIELPYNMKRYY